ncbi:hypothetical protein HPB47_015636 [Ixodes persulcatus]|uniref:Uncharacterized protein n=1 Tax=Ixodes persulcatus TaxID=34615 RepID=A0AC60QT27_IXOPE|nr:hypothetical protein HPB47_015636 [Ixodes persulcatus]
MAFMEEFTTQLRSLEHLWMRRFVRHGTWNRMQSLFQHLPYEKTTLLELISTDNKILNKVITVLAALCVEAEHLCHEAKTRFHSALLFYGEGSLASNNVPDGEPQQMSALFDKSKPSCVIDVTDVHFQTVFEHLGQMLASLVTLDEIVQAQSALREHWTLYRRMLKSVHHNCAKFDVAPEDLKALDKLMGQLEYQLLQGRIFMGCLEQGFDDTRLCVDAKLGETNELDKRKQLIGIYALYVLYYYIYRTIDKKFFKALWDVYKKVPAVHILGNILWFPDQFLMLQMPQVIRSLDKKAQDAVKMQRLNFLQQKSASLSKMCRLYMSKCLPGFYAWSLLSRRIQTSF